MSIFGAEFRRVDNREHLGKPASVAIAARTYPTTVDDLWDAVTTPDRLRRWFLPVEGELSLGGRYQLRGHAGGRIERCEAPTALDLTWEMHGGVSWLLVRIAADGAGARLTLEHVAHREQVGEAFLAQYGPGAVGVGWDLTLHGLGLHLVDPAVVVDPAAAQAWTLSADGRAFVRASGEAWGAAEAAAGAPVSDARDRAERTIAFYTGADQPGAG
ncbi:MAG: SRPBCC domain-containing protein [Myxococcota bacterium]